jgi:adenine-specific DNA-methyltransferase
MSGRELKWMSYNNSTTPEERKKFGQFFTPPKVSDFMMKWVLAGDVNTGATFLDPAVGLGIFQESADKITKNHLNFDCFDVDENILSYCEKNVNMLQNLTLNFQNKDFLTSNFQSYDGIICNPPYLNFHDYQNLSAISSLEQELSIEISGYSNIYVLFMIKCLNQLNQNARMAFIIPCDFMNTGYGVAIKEYLLQSKLLRHVILFDENRSIFQEASVTSCILLFENNNNSNSVLLTKLPNDWENFLTEQLFHDNKYIDKGLIQIRKEFSDIKAEEKWPSFFKKPLMVDLEMLCSVRKYGRFKRGIATGDNNYFLFNKSKAEKFGIDGQCFLKPCISKSDDVQSDFFTEIMFQELVENDRKIFLLDVHENELENEHLAEYLDLATSKGVLDRYLVKNRSVWHKQEQKGPAPIWASVFNRNRIKFIRNRANILNLTTFHGFHPVEGLTSADLDLLHAFFLTDICREIFSMNDRSYGEGLSKFEPGDLNGCKTICLDKIDEKLRWRILELYQQYEVSADCKTNLLIEIEKIFNTMLRTKRM